MAWEGIDPCVSLGQVFSLEDVVAFELCPQLGLRVKAKLFEQPDFKHVDFFTLDPEVYTDKEPFRKIDAIFFDHKVIKILDHQVKSLCIPQKRWVQKRFAFEFGRVNFILPEEPEFSDAKLINVDLFGVTEVVCEEKQIVLVGKKVKGLVFLWFLL